MSVETYNEIKSSILNYSPGIYFFYGDEDFFINNLYELLRSKYNNTDIFYGDECNILDILKNKAYEQNIFLTNRVIVIKNAEFNKLLADKKNENVIKQCIENFKANTIVVIIYNKKIPNESWILRAFNNGFIFLSKKLPSYKIKNFIKNFCIEHNINVDDTEINELYNNYSDNLSLITTELENHNINNVTYLKEFNAFEFLTYITTKNVEKLTLVINNFKNKNKNDIIPFLGLLLNHFIKQLSNIEKEKSVENTKNNNDKKTKRNNLIFIIETLKYCDNWIKGINSNINEYKYILKYLIGQLLNNL